MSEGVVHSLRPKLMTVCVVLASPIPMFWESGVGTNVMKVITAPIVGGVITSAIHVLILVPVFFRRCRSGRFAVAHSAHRSSNRLSSAA